MTRHSPELMRKAERCITEPNLIRKILNQEKVAVLAMHDEPYPYTVCMNYGYTWQEGEAPVFYFHCGPGGLREKLIQENPHVTLNIHHFIDRYGYERVHGFDNDYRSVHVYGLAEFIDAAEQPEEFLKGLSCMNSHQRGLPPLKKIAPKWLDTLRILKITASEITARAKYPLQEENARMPENRKKGN